MSGIPFQSLVQLMASFLQDSLGRGGDAVGFEVEQPDFIGEKGGQIDHALDDDKFRGADGGDSVTDAVGPERPTFLELVTSIKEAVGSRSRLVRVPGGALPLLSQAVGLMVRDVLLTRDEYRAMADGLADTEGPATGPTALSDWLVEHRETLGLRYANELARHF